MATNKIVLGRYEEVRDGVPLKYKIQTVTSDLIDDVIEYMMAHFLTRQPLVAHDGLLKEKHSVSSYQNFWKNVLECGESIVALEDREDERINILGVNLLNTSRKRQPFKEVYKGEKFNKFLKFVKELTAKGEVVFEAHDIEKYQKSCGLSVHTDYSGYKIGYRLLICQDLLCKRLGYRFICTIFTSRPAQHLAGKLHYQTIAEEKYETMEIDGQIAYPGLTGSAKLMCKALAMLKKLQLGSFVESRKSGEVLKYRIETISPELIEPVIEHMVKFFLTRELISVYDGILKQEESFNSFIKLWRDTLPSGTAMVALEERDDGVVNLVGVNVTLILEKDKKEEAEEPHNLDKRAAGCRPLP
ncbi:uncharacterized protein isoform X2 [Rhodnius prolixus]|uniref:uncharacterized protein isoform X2 n=1 Tax=Rhodnius prolixus TaxID=13249 RepID=UPI003D18CBEF